MTKAIEGFTKRHPSVTDIMMMNNGEDRVDAAYLNEIERRFYR